MNHFIMNQYVTFWLGEQFLGLPVESVQEIIFPQRESPIPMAPHFVSGLLNLRGHVITSIDLRQRLSVAGERDPEKTAMNIVVKDNGELFSLIVDEIGDVLTISSEKCAPVPSTLDSTWRECALNVCKLSDSILVVLDTRKILNIA